MSEKTSVTIPTHKPKLEEMLFFLLSGVIVSIPLTSFIYTFSGNLLTPLPTYAGIVSVVLLAPLVEEFSKAYPLFYRHAETERSIFTLGFMVGIGFGIVEFVEYVVFFHIPVLLRLPGIFFHASSTSIIAFGIGRKRPLLFYLAAVSLHMLNNLFAYLGPIYLLGGPVVIGLTYYACWFLYGKTEEHMIPF